MRAIAWLLPVLLAACSAKDDRLPLSGFTASSKDLDRIDRLTHELPSVEVPATPVRVYRVDERRPELLASVVDQTLHGDFSVPSTYLDHFAITVVACATSEGCGLRNGDLTAHGHTIVLSTDPTELATTPPHQPYYAWLAFTDGPRRNQVELRTPTGRSLALVSP